MTTLEEGRVIGSYRVVRCIGQGGMGTVYEVEHVELGVHYALKTFTFDLNDDASHALKKKFLEEGKVLARLKHPNIAHVFDLAFDDTTQMPYFVMDLVTYEDGESYTVEDVDLNDIDEDMVYGWFRDLASALDYIHGEGIVHRDIKPGNLLVDKNFHVVLTDFGISRIFGAKLKTDVSAVQTMVTKTGRGKLIVGTDKYIAPEVAHGEDATPAADAYALGVMLLRWLTGFYYEDNPGALAMLKGKKYRWHAIVGALLARDPAKRPQSYTPLIVQLKSSPHKIDRKEAARRRRKRNLRYAAAFSVAVLALIAVIAWIVWQLLPKTTPYEVLPRSNIAVDRTVSPIEKEPVPITAPTTITITQTVVKVETTRQPELPPPVTAPTPEPDAPRDLPIAPESIRPAKPTPPIPLQSPTPEITAAATSANRMTQAEDLGAIPNVKYRWHASNAAADPLRVSFQLGNGATMELMPMKKGSFFMSNLKEDVYLNHKVTFTYDFWMTKYLVTAQQWRDYAPFECEDCRKVEMAVKGKYPVCKRFHFDSITNFCAFMTRKYRAQLPEGFVFRLPTEAELEYTAVGDSILSDFSNGNVWCDYYKKYIINPFQMKGIGVARFQQLSESCKLDSLGKWESVSVLGGTRVSILGLADPFDSGVYDCWERLPISDRFKEGAYSFDSFACQGGAERVKYVEDEVDPLKWYEDGAPSYRYLSRYRTAINNKSWTMNFHLVVAPSLDKLCTQQKVPAAKPKVQSSRRYNWTVPRKLAHAKEIDFKLNNGATMTFCACPAGKFIMSNVPGQANECHQVTITRPFWMSKYIVTAEQCRDYGKYDCEGDYRIMEAIIKERKSKLKVYAMMGLNEVRMAAFFRHLNENYRDRIPKGYVFRLPTEAELEYAMKSGEDEFPKGLDSRGALTMSELQTIFKKDKRLQKLHSYAANDKVFMGIKFGGCGVLTKWGFYDLGYLQETLDTGVCDEDISGISMPVLVEQGLGEAAVAKYLNYKREMVDPCGWDGKGTNVFRLVRGGVDVRQLQPINFGGYVRVVIGPDLLAEQAKRR